MAKLKTNHNTSKRPFVGLALRVFTMFAILSILFVMFYRMVNNTDTNSQDGSIIVIPSSPVSSGGVESELIPGNNRSEVVTHQYYTLGYDEQYEQAAWVSYKLTKANLKIPNVPRADRFKQDPMVSTQSAAHSDYSRSGYSRGHMAPAGDMAQNKVSMQESFFMSNMSPQKIPFNGGIWRELEECVRDWAYKENTLYIVTGPILNDVTQYIGKKSKVGVPKSHYKVILDIDGRDQKGIAFIMENERSSRPIMDFAVSIDEVERLTGLDFFSNLLTDLLEDKLEREVDIRAWKVSNKRYQNRTNSWNNQN
ncbi:MAG: endonuclease G [Saprospiraceae bacterium]|jgi:endonuclease G